MKNNRIIRNIIIQNTHNTQAPIRPNIIKQTKLIETVQRAIRNIIIHTRAINTNTNTTFKKQS